MVGGRAGRCGGPNAGPAADSSSSSSKAGRLAVAVAGAGAVGRRPQRAGEVLIPGPSCCRWRRTRWLSCCPRALTHCARRCRVTRRQLWSCRCGGGAWRRRRQGKRGRGWRRRREPGSWQRGNLRAAAAAGATAVRHAVRRMSRCWHSSKGAPECRQSLRRAGSISPRGGGGGRGRAGGQAGWTREAVAEAGCGHYGHVSWVARAETLEERGCREAVQGSGACGCR